MVFSIFIKKKLHQSNAAELHEIADKVHDAKYTFRNLRTFKEMPTICYPKVLIILSIVMKTVFKQSSDLKNEFSPSYKYGKPIL